MINRRKLNILENDNSKKLQMRKMRAKRCEEEEKNLVEKIEERASEK
jgi:hypothetical protein